ncbi:hypothetical protein BDR26DRAFT_1005510 [Obelidium mucronatum]|nr:hypothetical protein BDR26DRAFT_1005510 [Obelidium mucronatum]
MDQDDPIRRLLDISHLDFSRPPPVAAGSGHPSLTNTRYPHQQQQQQQRQQQQQPNQYADHRPQVPSISTSVTPFVASSIPLSFAAFGSAPQFGNVSTSITNSNNSTPQLFSLKPATTTTTSAVAASVNTANLLDSRTVSVKPNASQSAPPEPSTLRSARRTRLEKRRGSSSSSSNTTTEVIGSGSYRRNDSNSSSSGSTSRRQEQSTTTRNLTCFHCQTTKSPFWRRTEDKLNSLCNACGLYYKKNKRQRPHAGSPKSAIPTSPQGSLTLLPGPLPPPVLSVSTPVSMGVATPTLAAPLPAEFRIDFDKDRQEDSLL